MEKILKGLARFQTEVFPAERELSERLASGQQPEALLLTCSDSRIVPEMITQTKPGDLFICRNAGNIAPAYGEVTGGVSATIEYSVVALGVRDIIVCGHSDCGAMKALLDPRSLAGMPAVAAWLKHAEPARVLVQENYPHLEERERLALLIEQNVLAQLANLRTHPPGGGEAPQRATDPSRLGVRHRIRRGGVCWAGRLTPPRDRRRLIRPGATAGEPFRPPGTAMPAALLC